MKRTRDQLRLVCTSAMAFVLSVGAIGSDTLRAQSVGGVIVDSLGRPLADAEVILGATESRTRSDAQGRFSMANLDPGSHLLRVRLIGYRPYETRIRVAYGQRATLRIVLIKYPALLDTVRVVDQGVCPPTSLDGFECRRAAQIGHFRDAGELRSLRPNSWADMLDGMPGIRRRASRGPYGLDWRIAPPPGRCIVELWNGQRPMRSDGAEFQPDEYWQPNDVVAIEYYDAPEKVPANFRVLAWPTGSERCALVIYWLRGARAREQNR